MAEIVIKSIRFKRGTSASWARVNPVLLNGEPGFETDTNKIKIGDGSKAWNNLPYMNGTASIGADGKSLVITNNQVSLYGYNEAQNGQIPSKSESGLEWINITMPEELSYEETLAIINNIQRGE